MSMLICFNAILKGFLFNLYKFAVMHDNARINSIPNIDNEKDFKCTFFYFNYSFRY